MCTNTYILSRCSPALLLKTISVSPSSPFSAASGPLDWSRSSSLWRYGFCPCLILNIILHILLQDCLLLLMRLINEYYSNIVYKHGSPPKAGFSATAPHRRRFGESALTPVFYRKHFYNVSYVDDRELGD